MQRIIAEIVELDVAAEDLRGLLGFGEPRGLHLVERHSRLAPHLGALAALAERKAHDLHVPAALGVKRDRAARAPDEIAGVGDNDEPALAGFGFAHRKYSSDCSELGGVAGRDGKRRLRHEDLSVEQ
jgi:hypothetical protein